jgi:hypothetical protein
LTQSNKPLEAAPLLGFVFRYLQYTNKNTNTKRLLPLQGVTIFSTSPNGKDAHAASAKV